MIQKVKEHKQMKEMASQRNGSKQTESDEFQRSHAIKRTRVVEFLHEKKLDGILLTQQNNFAWYTDGARSHVNVATEEGIAELLITRSDEHLFVGAIESRRMTEEEFRWKPANVHINAWWEDLAKRKALVKKQFGNNVGVDTGQLRQEFARVRYSLLPHEVERYRALGKDIAGMFWDVTHILRPGMTELDLAAEISLRLVRQGIDPLVNLVAFDERARTYRNPMPTSRELKNTVLISVCGRRFGLTASASRQIVLSSVSEEFRKKHAAVARVDAWMLQQTTPRIRVADIFNGIKEQYTFVGYPNEWYLHHQGGATGYSVRDYRATEASREVVQENQAFAWNPTITGTKSEDTIVVNERSFEVLTYDTHWPALDIELNGIIIKRPDVLILD